MLWLVFKVLISNANSYSKLCHNVSWPHTEADGFLLFVLATQADTSAHWGGLNKVLTDLPSSIGPKSYIK